jgi:C_GCAxxG_C_C family probable redox protein
MERSEKARSLFLSGNNCAQSVLLTFADDLSYNKELAVKLAAGFGGGMGRTQGTCGAVTGAIMVLGLMRGEHVHNNEELKSETYSSVQELVTRFREKFQSTNCRDLTDCDFCTAEGSEKFKDEKIMETACASFVEEAVRILESIGR